MHEPDPGVANVVEQHLRAGDIRLDELGRAEDRAVDMRLGREVDDRVAARGRLGHGIRVADVADEELDPASLQVGRIARIGQLVEHADVVAGGQEPLREVGADEARPAGDQARIYTRLCHGEQVGTE